MARYTPQHKEETRRRIIAAAGRRLKSDGIDGSGVAVLMADAGLTNGAFATHFASKEELVALTVADQLATQRESLRRLVGHPEELQDYLRAYLSTAHRDSPADGCPSGALLDEIARSSPQVRDAYTDGVVQVADAFADALGPHAPPEGRDARVAALGVLASLVGALQLSRALTDPDLAQAVLDQALATLPTHPVRPAPEAAPAPAPEEDLR